MRQQKDINLEDTQNYNGILLQAIKLINQLFLFSFDHQEKYIPKNDNSTIRCDAEAGPWFGCNYPEIILRSLNRGRSWNNSQNTFVENQKLTNGEEYWDVKELEVFQIIVI